jgi:Mycothiol maleylpyruvate isomerase N-terminal domain
MRSELDTSATADPGREILTALRALPPSAPTACAGWTAHHIAAHLAAGSKELADLAEERLAGRRERPTGEFEAREQPFRAMPYHSVLERLHHESRRKLAAYDALRARAEQAESDAPGLAFTGTHMTIDELTTHAQSEATIHRSDLVGDDPLSAELLARPELTSHAIKVLNRMPILQESARAVGARAFEAIGRPVRILLTAPNDPDVVIDTGDRTGHVYTADHDDVDIDHADVIVSTDAADRLLILWGRRSSSRQIESHGAADVTAALPRILWPNARTWPSESGSAVRR